MDLENQEMTIYYSVYCNEYESGCFKGDDVLEDVRKKFFKSKSKIKNRVSRKMYGEMYHYLYSFESQRPARWKKVVGGEILERSKENGDGYEIISQDKNKKIFKIEFFDLDHSWTETKYFSNLYKAGPVMTINPTLDGSLKVKEFNKSLNVLETYVMSPQKLHGESQFIKVIPKVICSTNKGELLFYKDLKKDEVISSIDDFDRIEEKQSVGKGKKEMNEEKIIDCANFDKHVYFGELKDGMRHGHGRTVSVNGCTVYEGGYVRDKREGLGVYFYSNREIGYVGEFKEGKKNGVGVSFQEDGELVHVGKWEDDLPKSMCSTLDKKGNLLFTGNIINSKKNGLGILYDNENGRVLVGSWSDGKFSGIGTIFNSSGQVEYSGEISEDMLSKFMK